MVREPPAYFGHSLEPLQFRKLRRRSAFGMHSGQGLHLAKRRKLWCPHGHLRARAISAPELTQPRQWAVAPSSAVSHRYKCHREVGERGVPACPSLAARARVKMKPPRFGGLQSPILSCMALDSDLASCPIGRVCARFIAPNLANNLATHSIQLDLRQGSLEGRFAVFGGEAWPDRK